MAHRHLLSWLVRVSSHRHATSAAHAHSSHRLLLLLVGHGVHDSHRLLLLLLGCHRVHAGHGLEWHRLEATRSWWLLFCAEGASLGLILSGISVYKLSKWICPWYLLLRLKLIRLLLSTCTRLLLIVVVSLEHVDSDSRVATRVGSQRLIGRRKDIVERIRGLTGISVTCHRRIVREDVEEVVCHILLTIGSYVLVLGLSITEPTQQIVDACRLLLSSALTGGSGLCLGSLVCDVVESAAFNHLKEPKRSVHF